MKWVATHETGTPANNVAAEAPTYEELLKKLIDIGLPEDFEDNDWIAISREE